VSLNQEVRMFRQNFKFIEAKPHKELNFSQKIIDISPAFIVLLNPEGHVIRMNQSMRKALGYSSIEVHGTNYLETFIPEADRDGLKEHSTKHSQNGEAWFNTNCLKKRDGDICFVEWGATVLTNSEGKVDCFLGVGVDVSERIALETKVLQIQKMESIGRLAGGVAHDLNNLLAPIIGNGELLAMDLEQDDPRHRSAVQIIEAGLRARDLVNRLLAFSRKQPLNFRNIDLNNIILNFNDLLRCTIRADITIDNMLTKNLPPIKGDIIQLEQVIMNLSVNAQDAMVDGGKLTISTTTEKLNILNSEPVQNGELRPGKYVACSITDTGAGIEPHILKKIFEPFFTTKGRHLGTGLGLATVYGIVQQHGGTVVVTSEVGIGSTFKVYLPAQNVSLEETQKKTVQKNYPNTKCKSILLVEDNAQTREVAFRILKRSGFRVLCAENGKKAKHIIEQNNDTKIDLLLTDIIMPEMDGRQLYESIKGDHPQMKVLFISGYADDIISHRGVMTGDINFLRKPFRKNELIQKVREILGP
jgi:two-component system, cell cycle sensor histidine kinase and response regulator CckA